MPAKAGIQNYLKTLDSRLRGNDVKGRFKTFYESISLRTEITSDCVYSIVTITTLGYGDIFPVTTAAKSCAILEAVIGQFYLVITLAWLVGFHISQSLEKKDVLFINNLVIRIKILCSVTNGAIEISIRTTASRFLLDIRRGAITKDEFGGIEDFWAECVGLSDSAAGSSVRCVWRSLKGEKAFSVLTCQPLKKGAKVTGQFVGGTGSLKGVTGTLTFTWTSTFTDKDQGMFTGHTQDLSGSYRIP